MFFVLLEFDSFVFAIDAISVETVLSYPKIEECADCGFVEGKISYKGMTVPVLDFCKIISNRNCRKLFSCRCVLVKVLGPDSQERFFGVLSEGVTRTAGIAQNTIETFPSSLGKMDFFKEFHFENSMAKIVDCKWMYSNMNLPKFFAELDAVEAES